MWTLEKKIYENTTHNNNIHNVSRYKQLNEIQIKTFLSFWNNTNPHSNCPYKSITCSSNISGGQMLIFKIVSLGMADVFKLFWNFNYLTVLTSVAGDNSQLPTNNIKQANFVPHGLLSPILSEKVLTKG